MWKINTGKNNHNEEEERKHACLSRKRFARLRNRFIHTWYKVVLMLAITIWFYIQQYHYDHVFLTGGIQVLTIGFNRGGEKTPHYALW